MLKNQIIVVAMCCLLSIAGCGGSSGSSDSGSSVEEKGGPLAGTWIGSANGVTHTITISGWGNTYAAAWDTSDDCFTSESGTTVHFDRNIEILCSGYDDNQQRYIFLSINGEFDGENAISGQIYAEECGAYDEPIVLAR